jgi:hypothetical protein
VRNTLSRFIEGPFDPEALYSRSSANIRSTIVIRHSLHRSNSEFKILYQNFSQSGIQFTDHLFL